MCYFALRLHAGATQYKSTSGTNDWASGLGFNAVPVSTNSTSIYLSNSGTSRRSTNSIPNFVLNSLQWDIGAWTTCGNGSLEFTNNGVTGPTVTNSTTANQNNLTLNWPIQLDASLTFDQAPTMSANIECAGTISGTGGLIKNSPRNSLTLSGTNANTYGGSTVINGGWIQLNKTTGIAIPGNITVGNGSAPAGLLWLGTNQLSTSSLITFNGTGVNAGILCLSNFSDDLGGLASTAGAGIVENNGANLAATLTISVSGANQTFAGIIQDSDGTVGGAMPLSLTVTGSGTQTLTGVNTYSGLTTIGGGTLTLGATGSINNSAAISLAPGGTFDVSAFANYNWSSNTVVIASGTGTGVSTAATIAGNATVNLNSQPIMLTIAPTATNDITHPALRVSSGALTLNNNVFTITNNSGSLLASGTYRLIQVGNGSSGVINQVGSSFYPVKVYLPNGTGGLMSRKIGIISVSSGNVVLTVTNAPLLPAATLTVAGFPTVTGNPVPPAALGLAGNVTVTALDTNGIIVTNYTGTVTLKNNDPAGSSPVSHIFKTSDAGVFTFTNGLTLNTVGTWTVTATDNTTPVPLTGTENVCAAFIYPPQAMTTSDASVSTTIFTAGVMNLGITTNGGGFVNRLSISGGTNLMNNEYQYGRGWQGSVRDSLHRGDYNPTQAGFNDTAGVQVSVTLTNGQLRINPFNMPLFDNSGFDFTKFENICPDYNNADGGNSDMDGFAEPAGWTQDDEVRSEFDFQGFYQDATALTGGQASAVRFWQRYSYIRDPKSLLQFGPAAVDATGAAVYDPTQITQAGDISSVIPGTQLATPVDMANIIFTSYGIRFDSTTGYTNATWYSGGQWFTTPLNLGGANASYTIPGSGITPTVPNNPDYGFLILANGTNPATAKGFALYVPMTEVNKKCVVGLNKTNGAVAYRENRLTDCILLFSSAITAQASLRARYILRGMLDPENGLPGVYEALESDQYVLYGTPNQILAAVQTLETNLLAGTGPHGVPQTWLDAYGITNENSDLDGDGMPAWQEYLAGTDPANPLSKLAFTGVNLSKSNLVLRWQAVAGKTYDILSTTNLATGNWITNASGISGVEPECALTNFVGNAGTFFRVRVE